jgi:hypothetical protein
MKPEDWDNLATFAAMAMCDNLEKIRVSIIRWIGAISATMAAIILAAYFLFLTNI